MLPISLIRNFSQDTINNRFSPLSPFRGRPLGEVLDKILLGHGRYLLVLLRDYSVTRRRGVWYTINNRTLWIIKLLLSRGYLKYVPAFHVADIRKKKFTTKKHWKMYWCFREGQREVCQGWGVSEDTFKFSYWNSIRAFENESTSLWWEFKIKRTL